MWTEWADGILGPGASSDSTSFMFEYPNATSISVNQVHDPLFHIGLLAASCCKIHSVYLLIRLNELKVWSA